MREVLVYMSYINILIIYCVKPLLNRLYKLYKYNTGTRNKGLIPSEININIVKKEFKKNYENEKLPFFLYFTNNSFRSDKSFLHFYKEIITYIKELSEINNDIYFITYNQLIEWMKNPLDIDHINSLNNLKFTNVKFNSTEIVHQKEMSCSSPNTCKYSSTVKFLIIKKKNKILNN